MDFYAYDESFRDRGVVAGIDEAGRGPLAGPVVAAAVVLPSEVRIEGLRDSKQLTEKQRKQIFFEILHSAQDIGVGISDADVIDRENILEATRLAMASAVCDLSGRPDFLLIDAVRVEALDIEQVTPYKGESLSASIAAASVVAKVLRDGMMNHYHDIYPLYGFDLHKGYATQSHLECLRKYGPCPLHRMSFGELKSPKLPL